MSRRRKGAAVHGWVVVDKPEGISSTQAVAIVRRVFDAQKAGHAGTLDPMATGVLAVASLLIWAFGHRGTFWPIYPSETIG